MTASCGSDSRDAGFCTLFIAIGETPNRGDWLET
jgi:hypothetical protein